MSETRNYKDLVVVQRSFELVRAVDRCVRQLPRTPQGRTIGDQLFRAASSIGANVAEGRGRDQGREYARYLRIARASANETDYWLRVARECELLTPADFDQLCDLTEQCLKLLSAMLTRLNQSLHEEPAHYARSGSLDSADL